MDRPGVGPARPGPSFFHKRGRGPTQPITFPIFHGPARPINFQKSRSGLARHNFQIRPARPGLDKRPMTSPGINSRGTSLPSSFAILVRRFCVSARGAEAGAYFVANLICYEYRVALTKNPRSPCAVFVRRFVMGQQGQERSGQGP